jgi:hypothetical protein
MLSQMRPYTPSLYQPGSLARYRKYPRMVRTKIPGAGYRVGRLVWAEQQLNLDGSSQPQNYGSYVTAPLRGLGSPVLTAAQANRDMGWTPKKLKAYWDARAKMCSEFADEGECLARVARHVPVTIGSLGQTTGSATQNVMTLLDVTAGLIRDPETTLRTRGPAIVAAADKHVVNPIFDKVGQAVAPYMVKYVLPPMAILYVLSGISAYYSFRMAKKMNANRRKRRR